MNGWTKLELDMEIEDGAWRSRLGEDPVAVPIERAGVLLNATGEGHPAVMLLVRLPDGQAVVAQTTLRLFLSAAKAFEARHGYPE